MGKHTPAVSVGVAVAVAVAVIVGVAVSVGVVVAVEIIVGIAVVVAVALGVAVGPLCKTIGRCTGRASESAAPDSGRPQARATGTTTASSARNVRRWRMRKCIISAFSAMMVYFYKCALVAKSDASSALDDRSFFVCTSGIG